MKEQILVNAALKNKYFLLPGWSGFHSPGPLGEELTEA